MGWFNRTFIDDAPLATPAAAADAKALRITDAERAAANAVVSPSLSPAQDAVKALSDAAAQQAAATQTALNEQTAALKAQTAIAQQSADAALASQKKALAASEAALIPTIDSEGARVAGESRQRKLQSTSPWGIGLQKKLGAAPVGFRVLSGQ